MYLEFDDGPFVMRLYADEEGAISTEKSPTSDEDCAMPAPDCITPRASQQSLPTPFRGTPIQRTPGLSPNAKRARQIANPPPIPASISTFRVRHMLYDLYLSGASSFAYVCSWLA
jgi:hypothetical protein